MSNPLLDRIQTNHATLIGVKDFEDEKFVHFFDLRNELPNHPDLLSIVALYRLTASKMRFSVFCATYFSQIELPKIKVVPKRSLV